MSAFTHEDTKAIVETRDGEFLECCLPAMVFPLIRTDGQAG